MPTLTGINYHQITFTDLESPIVKDNKIRFINALVEELISPVRGAKERDLTGEVMKVFYADAISPDGDLQGLCA